MTQPSSAGEPSQALPREAPHPHLHHVGIKTRRLDEMVAWYGTVVGMEVMRAYPFIVVVSNDAANHRLALVDAGTEDPDLFRHSGLQHLAFEHGSLQELLAQYVRLRELAILPHMTVDHGPTTSFYYVDPDGNDVELFVDNFGDWAQSSEWLRTAVELERNPIGLWVDPDELIAAWEAGASADEIHRRAYAGEFPPGQPPDLRLPPEMPVDDLLRLGYGGKLPGER
jgi:catechol 2,3-dioxygenase